MRIRNALFAVIVIPAAFAWPAAAFADDGTVLVDDDKNVALTFGTDRTGTASVTLSNPKTDAVTLHARATGSELCKPDESADLEVPGHTQKAVAINFTNCDADSTGNITFDLYNASDTSKKQVFGLTAVPSRTPSPDWGLLWWFVWAGLAGFATLLATYGYWMSRYRKKKGVAAFFGGLDDGLALGSTWTFKESWASNATLVTAAFTGVVGVTDIAKTIFGETQSKDVLAVVGVAAAAGLSLAGVAPMLLQSFRTRDKSEVTPFGLIAAGTLTVAGTGGALYIVVKTVYDPDAGHHDWVRVVGFAGAVLLVLYTYGGTLQNLIAGTPKAAPVTIPAKELITDVGEVFEYVLAREKYDNLPDDKKKETPEPKLADMTNLAALIAPTSVVTTQTGAAFASPLRTAIL